MSQNLVIDPVKRDYVFVNGSPVPSDRVFEACYYALLIPQNNWLYGQPSQGSLLYTLEQIKRTSSVEQFFSSISRNAIDTQVIATGKASQVDIRNTQATSTGSVNTIGVVPAAQSVESQFNFTPV